MVGYSIIPPCPLGHGQGDLSTQRHLPSFHHDHSTAHEVLSIVRGWAKVQLGGEQSISLIATGGTVPLLPTGTGYKWIDASDDLLAVDAYPPGQNWDLCRGTATERATVLANIRRALLPDTDPVFRVTSPLVELWLNQHER